MTAVRTATLAVWLVILFAAYAAVARVRTHRTQRRAEEVLAHAKHYLHCQTGHQNNYRLEESTWAAIDILTEKML